MPPSTQPVALITGGSRGLGLAMARRFSRGGFAVVVLSRSEPEETFAAWIPTDITDPQACRDALAQVHGQFGRLDLLINNAGMGMYETWEATDNDSLRRLFEINFFAMVELTRQSLWMLRESRGAIINTASIAGKLPVACMGAYCATKYAVTAFSHSLRIELKPQGIHVLNLVVGRIGTGFSDHSLGSRTPPASPQFGPTPTAEALAERTWRAWRKRKRELTYPRWYACLLPFVQLFPAFYERKNIRLWKLDD